ncbi:unnamed protein product [Phytophthora fragariaefolia]|uniref:Unnamed protein product n=1 Tax=Phytophthora fragariaefolia TaxID=1490495 RepID=A0A9W6XXJ1_9STRA|nr:unnamed protein product [Phytophthora fragariaefolia]
MAAPRAARALPQQEARAPAAAEDCGAETWRRAKNTLDRTSSEDEHQRVVRTDPGLPPMAPLEVSAKAAAKQAPVETGAKPAVKTPVLPPAGAKKAQAAAKKPTVSAERRRKRKAEHGGGISQTSALMLFRCSCRLLRSQTLDYDVRAREMEDRNAAQLKDIREWEKRVRGLKRELQAYVDELGEPSAASALLEAAAGAPASAAAARGPEDAGKLSTAVVSASSSKLGAGSVVDASLPPSVAAAEAKLQEELGQRTEKMGKFCRSAPGFIESPDVRRL